MQHMCDGGLGLKFKIELSLLVSAVVLYVISAFCYSQEGSQGLPVMNYSCRNFALPLVGVASVFVVIAGILYSKRK